MTELKGMSRRSFLAAGALGLTTLAVAGCATEAADTEVQEEPQEQPEPQETPADTGTQEPSAPEASAEPEPAPMPEQDDGKGYIGFCRGNCGEQCLLEARVREGKIVSTYPVTFTNEERGYEWGCLKGQTNVLRIYGDHRVLYPMKRVGERGAGEWERISWDEAFGLIADRFNDAIDNYGPSSVAFENGFGHQHSLLDGNSSQIVGGYYYPGNVGLGESLIQQHLGVTSLAPSGDEAFIYMDYGIMSCFPTSSLEDMVNAKTLVMWGSNPAEATFSRSSWQWTMAAKEAGAKLITIDPLYTSSVAASDEWVPVRVGSDPALACAMCNYILENNLYDEGYLKAQTISPFLIKEDGMYLRVNDVAAEPVDEEANVPVVFDQAANDFIPFAEAQDPSITGVTDANGIAVRTVFDAAVDNIKDITVDVAAHECGIPAEQIIGLAEQCAKNTPTTYHVSWGLEHTAESYRMFFCTTFLASLTQSMGSPGASYLIGPVYSGATSSLVVPPVIDNSAFFPKDPKPVKVITNERLAEIMESGKWAGEDYPIRSVYIHGADPLDSSTGVAEIIKAYEKLDFICVADSFMTTTAHYADLVLPAAMPWESEDYVSARGFMQQKAIDPLGEAMPDYDILSGIAQAMGIDDLFTMTREECLRSCLDTPENLELGIGYDYLHEHGFMPTPEYQQVANVSVETNEFGRIRFYSEPFPGRDDYGQVIATEDRLPSYAHAWESYVDNPDREKYPLFGFSNHDNYHGQSVFAHNQWLDEFRTVNGMPFVRIHEKAAAERGIKTGDKVRVFNDHGTCVLAALVTKGIREDTIWVPHGFFWDEFEEGFPQLLSGMYMDPVSSNGNFNDWICEVEKA